MTPIFLFLKKWGVVYQRKLKRKNFVIHVREFEFAAGAGFVIPILGEIMRMPGLPATPASEMMDIDNNGFVTGLS